MYLVTGYQLPVHILTRKCNEHLGTKIYNHYKYQKAGNYVFKDHIIYLGYALEDFIIIFYATLGAYEQFEEKFVSHVIGVACSKEAH